VERLAETSGAQGVARFSPDGRFVAYASAETGSEQIHIRAVGSQAAVRVTTSGGTSPVWSRDGRELFYVDPDRWIAVVAVRTTGGAVEVGPPERVMPRGNAASISDAFDVDRSGRFLIWTSEDANGIGDRTMLTVIENWTRLIGR
jgi:Tol biopolymer transport system component